MTRHPEQLAREKDRARAVGLSPPLRYHSRAAPQDSSSEGRRLAALEEEPVPEGRALGQKRLMSRLWLVSRKE
jgi:hypothetical protein